MADLEKIIEITDKAQGISLAEKEQLVNAVIDKMERPNPHWESSYNWTKQAPSTVTSKKLVIQGNNVYISKFGMSDIIRISAKIPYWLEVLKYSLKDVDKINILDAINQIITAIFKEGFDFKTGKPNDFVVTIFEELAMLCGLWEKHLDEAGNEIIIPKTEMIFSFDHEDLATVINAIIEVNKDSFFYKKIGNMIKPIITILLQVIEPIKNQINALATSAGGVNNTGETSAIEPSSQDLPKKKSKK